MERIVKLMTYLDSYDILESARASISVRELIERLEEMPLDAKIVLSHTDDVFGDISRDFIQCVDIDTNDEEEEEEDWMILDTITEDGIEISGLEGTYTCDCHDGIAFCTREDGEGRVVLHYPASYEITKKQIAEVLRYREIKRSQDMNFGDIMMALGKVVSNN